MTAMTAVETRNGLTPMSIRRVSADGRVVRVERREDEVAGERRLDRDLGGLLVADLADQDDVRRLAQHRAQDALEVEPDPVLAPRTG